MWWLGRSPNHHMCGSLLRARGFFITLLGEALPRPCAPAQGTAAERDRGDGGQKQAPVKGEAGNPHGQEKAMKRRVGRILKAVLLAIVVLVVLVAVRYGSEPRYLGANLLWDALDIPGWWDREVRLPFKEIPSSTADRSDQVTDEHDIMIPMRDGVQLSTDVYLPEGEGPFPVILVRLPYGKEEAYTYMPAIGRFWAHKGYAFVVQDVRGKFESEGTFVPFIHEVDDGYDTLEWISQQPWSDGNVGMLGESYYGYTTWAGAVSRHPALRAVAVSTISMDVYRTTFRNGALALQTMGDYAILMDSPTYQNDLRLDWWHLPLETLASDAGLSDGLYQMLVDNPVRNAVWDERNLNQHYADIDIPVLAFGGWYDVFLVGTMADWQGIRAESLRRSRRRAVAGSGTVGPRVHARGHPSGGKHRTGRRSLQSLGRDAEVLRPLANGGREWVRGDPARAVPHHRGERLAFG